MRRNKVPWLIIIIVVIGIITSFVLIFTETNAFIKQSTFTKRIVIQSDQETDSGYVVLKRDERSSIAADWAKFDTGTSHIFFSISDNEILEKKVFFNIPSDLESGKYYVKYEIVFTSGKKIEDEIEFRVV